MHQQYFRIICCGGWKRIFTDRKLKEAGGVMDIYRGDKVSQAEKQALIESLYRAHYDLLINYVFGMVGNMVLAEDIVQDTFYEAVRRSERLSVHPNKVGWLVETAKNKIREARRKAGPEGILCVDDVLSNLTSLEDRYSLAELNAVVEGIFSEHEWKLFRMYYLFGYTAKELAAMENITENNLKVRMHRYRKRLLDKVGALCMSFMAIGCLGLFG